MQHETMEGLETRTIFEASELRLETRAHQLPKIFGIAAVFEEIGQPILGMPELKERVATGAFDETIENDDEVLALFDHEFGNVLGRRSAGTLSLRVSTRGLHIAIDPPNTTLARDVIENIKAGNLKGMSIGFPVFSASSHFITDGSVEIREFTKIELVEVSIVSIPVFEGTDVNTRAKAGYQADLLRHRQEQQNSRMDRLQSVWDGV